MIISGNGMVNTARFLKMAWHGSSKTTFTHLYRSERVWVVIHHSTRPVATPIIVCGALQYAFFIAF